MDLDWHRPDSERLPSIEPLEQQRAQPATVPSDATIPAAISRTRPLPAIYLGHGAPMLLDDQEWVGQLGAWANSIPRPKQILIISAHWETAPMAISATERVPLVYDFYGFPEHYYRITYDAPGTRSTLPRSVA